MFIRRENILKEFHRSKNIIGRYKNVYKLLEMTSEFFGFKIIILRNHVFSSKEFAPHKS